MNAETESLIRASIATDVWRLADAKWWRKCAEDFERAKPRLGEFHGQRTREEVREAWRRCHASAEACRNRAALLETGTAA